MVAALAKAQQVPVIVATESYKFSEKVQLDSIVYNELGSASEIAVMLPPAANSVSSTTTTGSEESSVTAAVSAGGAPLLVPTPQRQTGYRGGADSVPTTSTGETIHCFIKSCAAPLLNLCLYFCISVNTH